MGEGTGSPSLWSCLRPIRTSRSSSLASSFSSTTVEASDFGDWWSFSVASRVVKTS